MLNLLVKKLSRRWVYLLGTVFLSVVLIYVCFFRLVVPLPEIHNPGALDMHVHAAGLGYGDSGAFVGDALRNSWKFGIYLRAFDVSERELTQSGDQVLLQKLSAKIEESDYVSSAVVLAMDGVMDEEGQLDRERTQFYVPNDYLMNELAMYPNLRFGASINPLRKDSIARLEHVAANGAVLIKWLPNIQLFDPADERITPFYKRMTELCLPLLTHTGAERSFGHADDDLGDPLRLELPLNLGVTVIAAHIATTGHIDGEEQFERFLRMYESYPNLYADISSLTQINKRGYLKQALAVETLEPRLLYGTDWPLQFFPLVSPYYLLGTISLAEANTVRRVSNQWDRDFLIKKYAGVPDSIFNRAESLLGSNCQSAKASGRLLKTPVET